MKKPPSIGFVMLWSLASCVAPASSSAVPSSRDAATVIFGAMKDELERSISQLEMEELGRPYFISYTVDDIQELRVEGSLGTLTKSELEHFRFVTIDLRVGDSRLDNSNFSSGYGVESPDYFRLPVDNDYDAIRNQIYLGTDKAYKRALKAISSKKAYLETHLIKDRPEDLIELEANVVSDRPEDFDIDEAHFGELARTASGVLRDYPMIVSSQLDLRGAVVNQYFASSSGTTALRGDRVYSVALVMSGKGGDGDDVSFDDRIIVTSAGDLPDVGGLVQWVRACADQMMALMAAGTIDDYSGPVIFTDAAAGAFFRQLFADHISDVPPPLFEDEDMAQSHRGPQLVDRVGRRVLPAFMDVYDDPTLDRLGSLKLIGAYEIDDAGGLPQRIEIVEKGKLVGLPIGTAPTRKVRAPNGHARGALGETVNGKPANLVIESSNEVSLEKLKAEMLEMCRDFDLEYGLVISKLADPHISGQQMFLFGGGPSGDMALSAPIRACKVFPDGREEPVRNLEFRGVTARVLRDIVRTDKNRYVHDYLFGNDYEMPVSIVCPAVLIEEMELKAREVKPRKPPILPSPLLEGN